MAEAAVPALVPDLVPDAEERSRLQRRTLRVLTLGQIVGAAALASAITVGAFVVQDITVQLRSDPLVVAGGTAPAARVPVQGAADLLMSVCGGSAGLLSGVVHAAIGFHLLSGVAVAASGWLFVTAVAANQVAAARTPASCRGTGRTSSSSGSGPAAGGPARGLRSSRRSSGG